MSWDGKTKGGVTGYKIFVYILKNLNIRFAYFALIFVAFYYYITLDKKRIRYYFRNILNQPTLKANFNIYRNFYLFGQTMIDKVAILAGLSKKFTFTFEGEEYLHQVAR